jgi:hypothetical protein
VAIPSLSLEKLLHPDEKKEKDKKREVHDEGGTKESSKSSGEEEAK